MTLTIIASIVCLAHVAVWLGLPAGRSENAISEFSSEASTHDEGLMAPAQSTAAV